MIKISVIIPIFNDEKYLRECLDSVSAQSLEELEIICVNDGSTDRSLEILTDYAKNDDRIIIINQTNQGSAISRNNGINIAKGEYIGFLDADDMFVDRDALRIMYETATENDAGMVSANLKFLSKKRKLKDNPHYDKKTFYYFNDYCRIKPDEYGIPFYFYKSIFKSELVKNNPFPNLLRGQDPVFLTKILCEIDAVYGVPVDFYAYMVPTSFDKLNTYTKKYHYLSQYKTCIDLLNENGLSESADKYLQNLMSYLKDNVDGEVYSIVEDTFDEEFFKNYKNEYESFKSINIINNILEHGSEDYYQKNKSEIKGCDDLINKSGNVNEFKINYLTLKLKSLDDECDTLETLNNQLKVSLDSEKSFNRKILNSKKWKLMNKIRR